MDENRAYYAIIPASVRYDKNITANAKLLYGEITALCNDKGFCWATNRYFAELYRVSKKTISIGINLLEKAGYITFVSDNDVVASLKQKRLQGLGYGKEVCEWCGIYTSVLHKHHYPIPKQDGGTKTVNICPNCHHEFHFNATGIKLNLSSNELIKILELRQKGG